MTNNDSVKLVEWKIKRPFAIKLNADRKVPWFDCLVAWFD